MKGEAIHAIVKALGCKEKDIKEIENALVALKALIALEQSGYSLQPNQVSDLKGLAQREQM